MDAKAQHKARVDKLCKQLPHRSRRGIEVALKNPTHYWQLMKQIIDCERPVQL
jgi:hypothetical protein